MKLLILLCLCLSGMAQATTVAELLQLALASDGEPVERELDGAHIAKLREGMRGATLYGQVQLLHELEQPGCGRYALQLRTHVAKLATLSLDLCADGLPPDPPVVRP